MQNHFLLIAFEKQKYSYIHITSFFVEEKNPFISHRKNPCYISKINPFSWVCLSALYLEKAEGGRKGEGFFLSV